MGSGSPEAPPPRGRTATGRGDPRFRDSDDVTVDLQGDPDQAGFVQVMQGCVTDVDRVQELMAQLPSDVMTAYRSSVLGSVLIGHEDGAWTQVVSFTSEAEAPDGEREEPRSGFRNAMEEMGKLSVGETTFLDLRRPVLQSAS